MPGRRAARDASDDAPQSIVGAGVAELALSPGFAQQHRTGLAGLVHEDRIEAVVWYDAHRVAQWVRLPRPCAAVAPTTSVSYRSSAPAPR